MSNLIPPWAYAVAGLVVVAVLFGAGWTVRGWKDGKRISNLKADCERAVDNSAAHEAAATVCREELNNVRANLQRKREELAEAQRLYAEAISRPPDRVIEYRDRWHDAPSEINAVACPDAVGQLVAYVHSLPGMEVGHGD